MLFLFCLIFYGIIVFAGFLLLRVTDRAAFYITQTEAHEECFEQKMSVVLALQR